MKNIRKAILIVSIAFAISIIFAACTNNNEDMPHTVFSDYMQSEQKKADDLTEQTLIAIRDKDKAALESLFSEKVLDDAVDLDKDIDELFMFIQGNVGTFGISEGLSDSPEIKETNDEKVIQYNCWPYISTNKNEYTLFMMIYTVDTAHPENEGLYALQIWNAKDKNYRNALQEDISAGVTVWHTK